jgi:hypothetical protein
MRSVEQRVSALEGDNGGNSLYHLTDGELQDLIERSCLAIGTTYAAEVARYGSDEAFLRALADGDSLAVSENKGRSNAQH